MGNYTHEKRFLRLLFIGMVIFISGLGNLVYAADKETGQNDFFFVQLSDTHWGFTGPEINPDADVTLKKAIATINNMKPQPDFVVFTGDLTHTTNDPKERRNRMTGFRDIINSM